jgi:hypothetical protein
MFNLNDASGTVALAEAPASDISHHHGLTGMVVWLVRVVQSRSERARLSPSNLNLKSSSLTILKSESGAGRGWTQYRRRWNVCILS